MSTPVRAPSIAMPAATPAIPTTAQLVAGLALSPAAMALSPAFLAAGSGASGAGAPLAPVFSSPTVQELGPEFAAVLARDYTRAQNWAALRAMGALDADAGTEGVFGAVAGATAFLTPPPMPAPLDSGRWRGRPSVQSEAAAWARAQASAAAAEGPRDGDEAGDEEGAAAADENGEAYEDEFSGDVGGDDDPYVMPGAGGAHFYDAATVLGGVQPSAASSGRNADLVESGDDPLAPLERVQLQLRLLGAQADSLAVQADRLEAGMAEEAAGVDLARAKQLLERRGRDLRAMRERADVLLARTTNSVAAAAGPAVDFYGTPGSPAARTPPAKTPRRAAR